jgi:phosphonate degradation associated HDIG domain protein
MTKDQLIDGIFAVFREHGAEQYLGERVSLTEHMLQAAYAAELDAAPPTLVAAALLHDYGHFVHEFAEDAAEHGIDTRHEEAGFGFLSGHFGPEVVEPIRMHVAAKRYLCAVEPSYLEELSPASVHSLELQGGPYGPREVAAFERSPHAGAAVRLRRYDDIGKVEGLETPELEHYRPVLEASIRS